MRLYCSGCGQVKAAHGAWCLLCLDHGLHLMTQEKELSTAGGYIRGLRTSVSRSDWETATRYRQKLTALRKGGEQVAA